MRRSRMRSSMRRRRGGQTAYQQTQGAYDSAGNALTSTGNALGNALGNAGNEVEVKTKGVIDWFSRLGQGGGSRRHRKRSSKGKGFLGMFNIFSSKRQGRSRKGGTAIMGTNSNSNTNMKLFAAKAVSAPVTKSFSATGGRRRRRGGQTTSHPPVEGTYPAAGGSRRRRGGQTTSHYPIPAAGGSRRRRGGQFEAAPAAPAAAPTAPLMQGGSTPQPYSPDVWTEPGAFPSAVGGRRRMRKGGQVQGLGPLIPEV